MMCGGGGGGGGDGAAAPGADDDDAARMHVFLVAMRAACYAAECGARWAMGRPISKAKSRAGRASPPSTDCVSSPAVPAVPPRQHSRPRGVRVLSRRAVR